MEKKNMEKEIEKPCKELGYCPYGCLVEYFPLGENEVQWNGIKLPWIKKNDEARACEVFGHDCPVYYVAEIFMLG